MTRSKTSTNLDEFSADDDNKVKYLNLGNKLSRIDEKSFEESSWQRNEGELSTCSDPLVINNPNFMQKNLEELKFPEDEDYEDDNDMEVTPTNLKRGKS